MDYTVKVYADPGPRTLFIGHFHVETLHPFPIRLDKQGQPWILAEVRPLPKHPTSVVYILLGDIRPVPTIKDFIQMCSPDPPYRDSLTNDLSLLPL